MKTHEYFYLILSSHQIILFVFSCWHFLFYLMSNEYVYALCGLCLGIPIHSSLLFSWRSIRYHQNVCMWIFSLITGTLGWLLSWCLVVSMNHWSMPLFLILLVIVDVGFFVFPIIKIAKEIFKKHTRIEDVTKKTQ